MALSTVRNSSIASGKSSHPELETEADCDSLHSVVQKGNYIIVIISTTLRDINKHNFYVIVCRY